MSVTGRISQSLPPIGLIRSTIRRPVRLLRSATVSPRLCYPTQTTFHITSAHRRPIAAVGAGTFSKSLQASSVAVQDAPWLIVGLGNPGAKYDGTRHNVRKQFALAPVHAGPAMALNPVLLQVGFQVLDTLARRLGVSLNKAQDKALQARATIAGHQVILAKPITFMNVSGEAVGKLTRYYKVCTCFTETLLLSLQVIPKHQTTHIFRHLRFLWLMMKS